MEKLNNHFSWKQDSSKNPWIANYKSSDVLKICLYDGVVIYEI